MNGQSNHLQRVKYAANSGGPQNRLWLETAADNIVEETAVLEQYFQHKNLQFHFDTDDMYPQIRLVCFGYALLSMIAFQCTIETKIPVIWPSSSKWFMTARFVFLFLIQAGSTSMVTMALLQFVIFFTRQF